MDLDKQVFLEIVLMEDCLFNADDHENWIPFTMKLSFNQRHYVYDEERGATFHLAGLLYFIKGMETVCQKALAGERFETFTYICLEMYFEMSFHDTLESDKIKVECWIFISELTRGRLGGEEGVRFCAYLDQFNDFVQDLKNQLREILILNEGTGR